MKPSFRNKLNTIIFGAHTPGGKRFDVVLLYLIVASVLIVMLESIPSLSQPYENLFFFLEISFTVLFTVEYALRIYSARQRMRYLLSYWGIIDFLGVVPFYLMVIAADYRYFVVLRLLRMLRVFRILRLLRFVKESQELFHALRSSLYKIIVFISFVLTIVVLLGTLMYVVEGPKNGFTSIPQSIYWTIVTITTVGYGDITPVTSLGKWIASVIMLCGYAIIAVPTGIVTVAMSRKVDTNACSACKKTNPDGASFCNNCGERLLSSAGRAGEADELA